MNPYIRKCHKCNSEPLTTMYWDGNIVCDSCGDITFFDNASENDNDIFDEWETANQEPADF